MNNPAHNHFLLIGLPSTGKTSFLAAVWYMVSQSSIDCALTLESLDHSSQYQYLNEIRDAWAQYKPVPRNEADSEKSVSMRLRNRTTARVAHLSFPDLSGEAFNLQWARRELAVGYDESLRNASGGVLFVHPDNIVKPHRIDMVEAVLEDIGDDEVKPKLRGDEKPWNIDTSPTQVKLVDILQFMIGRSYFRPPFRLALVVSAWDRIIPKDRRPAAWIATEFPLLKQFLDCNNELFEVSFYGISAQGARYALPQFWVDNFNECKPLANRICGQGDSISKWAWSKLDEASQTLLLQLRNEAATKLQKQALAVAFNKLMAEPDVYDEKRFAEVEMRFETQDLIKNGALRREKDKPYLSRLLLEDAYPQELSRLKEHAKEASELQDKPPGRRVLLVGDDVKRSHDVTEPIQWLMR